MIDFARARWAVATVFAANGAIIGSWAAQVPVAKERLALSGTELGFALLAIAFGAVAAMPFTGALCARFGSALVTQLSLIILAFLLPCLVLAPNVPLFLVVCLLFGIMNGLCDVAMNAQALEVETALAKPIMSGLHGMWSIGGFGAALLASFLLAIVSPLMHFVIVSALVLVSLAYALPRLLPKAQDQKHEGSHFALPTGPVILIGALTFLVMAAEGAMNDWSALFMTSQFKVSESFAAYAFAGYAGGMTTGRLAGDYIRAHFSTITVLRFGGALATLAIIAGTFAGASVPTIVGFAIAGLGMSNLVPLLYMAAGTTPGQNPATALAACATTGYFGFLVGPPMIGFIIDHAGIQASFVLIACGCAVITLVAGRIKTV